MSMNFDQARFNMVEQQVRPWQVLDDTILQLFETILREDFVPSRYRKLAFSDMSIPLDHGQVMMKPIVEGRMLQALEIRADETALEIGTGSGYISACLSHLAKEVCTVDIFEDFVDTARRRLDDKSFDNVYCHVGDALNGWLPEQQHDVVVVTGSVPEVPEIFKEWVNPGGRLFAVRGDSPVMEAVLMTRINVTEWTEESLFETDLVRLVNADRPPEFEF